MVRTRNQRRKKQRTRKTRQQKGGVILSIPGQDFYETFLDIIMDMANSDTVTTRAAFGALDEYLKSNWNVKDENGNTPLLALGKIYVRSGAPIYRALLLHTLRRLLQAQPANASISLKHYTGLTGVNSHGDIPEMYLAARDAEGNNLMMILHEAHSDILEDVCQILGDTDGCTDGRPSDIYIPKEAEPPRNSLELQRLRRVTMGAWEVRINKAAEKLEAAKELRKRAKEDLDIVLRKKGRGAMTPSLERELKFALRKVDVAEAAGVAANAVLEKVKADANEAVRKLGGEFVFRG
jgi:hypothetical protein